MEFVSVSVVTRSNQRSDDLPARVLRYAVAGAVFGVVAWFLPDIINAIVPPPVIDVRNPSEAAVASIAGSHLIPLSSIENGDALDQVRSLAQGKRLYVHCKLGGRSARAVQILGDQGVAAVNVDGGIDAWAQLIDPSMARY